MRLKESFLVILVLVFWLFPAIIHAEDTAAEPARLFFFHSLSCHSCIKVKSEFMPQIEERFGGQIKIEYRDIARIENYKLLLGLKEEYGITARLEPPIIFFAGNFLCGYDEIKNKLPPLIENALKNPPRENKKKSVLSENIIRHFLSFSPLAVIGAGLIDGINPCAFTVIVFFISFLALQGYGKRELIATGISFIFAVFLTYLLIGLGLFNFLYSLRAFQLVARTINFSIGMLSIALGIFALYDLFRFKRTGSSEGMILQLPQAVKNQIRRLIGIYYRRNKDRRQTDTGAPLSKLILTAITTGFLVSLLEAICTGQVYLPTIVFVLKTTPLKLTALSYLLLYNLMFILPLTAIFIFALLGTTSAQFSRFMQKRLILIKALLAAVFFVLGVFLIIKG